MVSDGEQVVAGEPLFDLESTTAALRSVQRAAQVAKARLRLASYRRDRDMYNEDIDLSRAENELKTAQILLENAELDLHGLSLRAPAAGTFCATLPQSPPGGYPSRSTVVPSQPWTERIGSTLPEGTQLGVICSRDSLVILPLAHAQLAFITAGTPVNLHVVGQDDVLQSRVEAIVDLEALEFAANRATQPPSVGDPWNFSRRSALAEQPGVSADLAARKNAQFAAVVLLPDDDLVDASLPAQAPIPGSSARAAFLLPSTTIAEASIRWLRANVDLLADR
jgi:hypothetical protein